ncbi:MAG: hypothetical protein NC349_00805 [Paenibacillus sp.]|nr:hypothetical protein [Paenibacillus sp.]
MEEYKDLTELLKPRRKFMASEELRARIDSTLISHAKKNSFLAWGWGIGISMAVAAIFVLIFIPIGLSAKEILSEAMASLRNADRISMIVEIRTRPMENFKYINPADDFVCHHIGIMRTDTTLQWRIDKGGRTAVGNSSMTYNWIDELKIGWSSGNDNNTEILGYLRTLLSPASILESELHQCADAPQAEYNITCRNDEIILTIHASPSGDFSNPYMLNASISESENIRRYVFDSDTKHLKSASISVLHDNRETEVLRISSISYNPSGTSIMELPADIEFIDVTSTPLSGLVIQDPTEAASLILKAFETWDKTVLDTAILPNLLDSMYEDDLRGAILVSVGKSFVSGNENTTFVPYILRLADGTEKRHNLAMQKNQYGFWIVIGGL